MGWMIKLFGGYRRHISITVQGYVYPWGYIDFLTRRGAERYGTGLSGLDPYARHMSLVVHDVPGKWLRKAS